MDHDKKIVDFPGRSRSVVWNYFGFFADENGEAKKEKFVCKICKRSFFYNGNTTNLFMHLDQHHNATYQEIKGKPAAYNSRRSQGHDDKLSKADYVTEALKDCLQRGDIHLQALGSSYFHYLTFLLDPVYKLPTIDVIGASIEEEYAKVTAQIQQEIKSCSSVSISVTHPKQKETEIKCHYILAESGKFTLTTRLLEAQSGVEQASVQELVKNLQTQWKLPSMTGVFTDESSQRVFSEIGSDHVPCFGRVLQEVVLEVLADNGEVISKAKELLKAVSTSPELCPSYILLCGSYEANNGEAINIDPRSWKKLRHTLSFVLSHSSMWHDVGQDPQYRPVSLTAAEKTEMGVLVEILQQFEKATELLAKSATQCLSLILPTLTKLNNLLSVDDPKKVAAIKARIKRQLDAKVNKYMKLYQLSSVVDPRTKGLVFLSVDERSIVQKQLMDECRKLANPCAEAIGNIVLIEEVDIKKEKIDDGFDLQSDMKLESCNGRVSAENGEPPAKKVCSDLDSWLDDVMTEQVGEMEDPITAEVKRYLAESSVGLQADPLVWWSQRATIYPTVVQLARRYLSIPACVLTTQQVFAMETIHTMDGDPTQDEIVQKRLAFIKANRGSSQ